MYCTLFFCSVLLSFLHFSSATILSYTILFCIHLLLICSAGCDLNVLYYSVTVLFYSTFSLHFCYCSAVHNSLHFVSATILFYTILTLLFFHCTRFTSLCRPYSWPVCFIWLTTYPVRT